MGIKELLKKPFGELTDEDFRQIGLYYQEHKDKLILQKKPVLHRCIDCKWCSWYENLGKDYWECQHNPCDDIKTQSNRLLTNHMVVTKRKCDNYDK